MARISTAAGKAKGRRLQQYTRDKILGLHPTLTEDDVRSCAMGSQGEDVQLSTAARALMPYSFECKARAKIGLIYDAHDQARRHGNSEPIAIVKADRKAPMAVITADHFFELQRELADLRSRLRARLNTNSGVKPCQEPDAASAQEGSKLTPHRLARKACL